MKVLSIDGGGSRGIIPLTIINYLKTHMPNTQFSDCFDYYTGSSVGIIIICLLLTVSNDSELFSQKTYIDFINSVFNTSLSYKLKTCFGLFGPAYDDKYKLNKLKEIFGEKKIKNLKKKVCIPIYDLLTNKIIFITNDLFGDLSIIDLLMSVTAAPTYFKPWKVIYDNKTYLFVDNGVITNNPCNLLISYMISNNLVILDDLFIVSIGTGNFNLFITSTTWGLYNWSTDYLNLTMNLDQNIESYHTSCLIKHNYFRLNVDIPNSELYKIDITDQSDLDKLINFTNDFIINNYNLINEIIINIRTNYHIISINDNVDYLEDRTFKTFL